MAKFPTPRSAALLCAACMLAASSAHAQVVLDKLNACADIERVYAGLRAEPAASPADCRSPRAGLEAALVSRMAGARTCFLGSSPAPFLNGFSCFRVVNQETGRYTPELTCFRAASMVDVQHYKDEYKTRFAPIESTYLAASKTCAVSNGDSSVAATSLFPPTMAAIARFQLGFVTLLGSNRPADSSVFHGFGQTDPAIRDGLPSAVEVVYVLVNATARRSVPLETRSAGAFRVEVDDTAGFERDLNEQFRRAGAPMRSSIMGYTLERDGAHGMTLSAKISLIGSLHDSVADMLADEGFDQLSDAEIRDATGKRREDLLAEYTRSVPFGSRDSVTAQKPVPSFRFLFNDTELRCMRNGRGAIMIGLMGFEPRQGVQRDFGSIALLVNRLGACAEGVEARTYAAGLLEKATSQIVEALGRR